MGINGDPPVYGAIHRGNDGTHIKYNEFAIRQLNKLSEMYLEGDISAQELFDCSAPHMRSVALAWLDVHQLNPTLCCPHLERDTDVFWAIINSNSIGPATLFDDLV